jgi:hypothetical protein
MAAEVSIFLRLPSLRHILSCSVRILGLWARILLFFFLFVSILYCIGRRLVIGRSPTQETVLRFYK